jgi:hypothetical protein
VYEQNGYKVEFTREPRRELKKEQDATLLRGQWKVVKEEYRDGTKWAEVPVPLDFAFAFSADSVTVIREKATLRYSLTLKPGEKVMNLSRAEGGIDKISQVIYRLLDDRLWICVVSGHLLPADAKAVTLRQYHLQRVAEPKK